MCRSARRLSRLCRARRGSIVTSLHMETVMSVTQNEKAARFVALHEGPGAFIIPNPWDTVSARILAGLGFQALATSSAASANTLGRKDGGLSRYHAMAHA